MKSIAVKFALLLSAAGVLTSAFAVVGCNQESGSPPESGEAESQMAAGSGKGLMGISAEERKAYIRKADAWVFGSAEEVSNRNMLLGPEHPFFTTPRQAIECEFVEPDRADPPGGRTPKFDCMANINGKQTKLKVKYDTGARWINGKNSASNMEVYGEVLSTRLLWALGFGADRIYTAQVTCKNCPVDPWTYVRKVTGILDQKDSFIGFVRGDLVKSGQWADRGTYVFDPAVVEIKYAGPKIESGPDSGWAWKEMYENIEDPARQKVYRDALTIVAAFIDHMDNKAEQQRLVCFSKDDVVDGKCQHPFLMVQDPGSSFGSGWAPLSGDIRLNKVDLEKWVKLNLWSDRKSCKVQVHGAPNASFRTTWQVTEESRKFVADLFGRLTKEQIKELFVAAQVDRLSDHISVDDWVEGFQTKVARDLTNTRCE